MNNNETAIPFNIPGAETDEFVIVGGEAFRKADEITISGFACQAPRQYTFLDRVRFAWSGRLPMDPNSIGIEVTRGYNGATSTVTRKMNLNLATGDILKIHFSDYRAALIPVQVTKE